MNVKKQMETIMEIPDKCKKCIHRVNDFCLAYHWKITVLCVENCKRKKVKKRWGKK